MVSKRFLVETPRGDTIIILANNLEDFDDLFAEGYKFIRELGAVKTLNKRKAKEVF